MVSILPEICCKCTYRPKNWCYGTPDATSAISNVNMMYGVEGDNRVKVCKIPYSITHYALLYDGQKLYNATKRNFSCFQIGERI